MGPFKSDKENAIIDGTHRFQVAAKNKAFKDLVTRSEDDSLPPLEEEEIRLILADSAYGPLVDEEIVQTCIKIFCDAPKLNALTAKAKQQQLIQRNPLNAHAHNLPDLLDRVNTYINYSQEKNNVSFDREAAVILIERDENGNPSVKAFISNDGKEDLLDNGKIIAAIQSALNMFHIQEIWT